MNLSKTIVKTTTLQILWAICGAILCLLIGALLVSPAAALSVYSALPVVGLQPLQDSSTGLAILGVAIGAGLAVGLAGIGAAIGMGTASAAALGAITEKPETFGRSILYVVFIEAIGVYGLAVALLLLNYIPALIT